MPVSLDLHRARPTYRPADRDRSGWAGRHSVGWRPTERRVVFVMKGGVVYKNVRRERSER